jgi:phosphoribosyl-ATP pyrophosphohydrolase
MAKAPKKRQQRPPATSLAGAPAAITHEDQPADRAGTALAVQVVKKAKPGTAKPPRDRTPKRAKGVKAPKKRKRRAPAVELVSVPAAAGHEDRLARLASAIQAVRAGERSSPRTAKLIAGGVPKMAQKLMEEAAETAIDAVREERAGFVNESADLLYNLVVLWSALGVTPGEVWAEMDRREALLGLAEKLPKADDAAG